MSLKKLSLDKAGKAVLIKALEGTRTLMHPDMRHIYDKTLEAVHAADDRVMLTAAQAEVVKHALRLYADSHGEDAVSGRMLAQLTMTRRQFAECFP